MTSFFDKLTLKLNGGKGKSAHPLEKFTTKPNPAGAPQDTPPQGTATEEELLNSERLDIDIYQDPARLIIYARAAGVDPDAFEVILDEENDLVSIRGVRKRPDALPANATQKEKDEGKFIQQECSWEPFFRKIVLPAEVDPVKAEAVFKKGVLVITLPILNVAEGRKLAVHEMLTKQ